MEEDYRSVSVSFSAGSGAEERYKLSLKRRRWKSPRERAALVASSQLFRWGQCEQP